MSCSYGKMHGFGAIVDVSSTQINEKQAELVWLVQRVNGGVDGLEHVVAVRSELRTQTHLFFRVQVGRKLPDWLHVRIVEENFDHHVGAVVFEAEFLVVFCLGQLAPRRSDQFDVIFVYAVTVVGIFDIKLDRVLLARLAFTLAVADVGRAILNHRVCSVF